MFNGFALESYYLNCKLSWDGGGNLQNTFEYLFVIETTLRIPIVDLYTEFSVFPTLYNSSFPLYLLFLIRYLQIHQPEQVPMNALHRLGFHQTFDHGKHI